MTFSKKTCRTFLPRWICLAILLTAVNYAANAADPAGPFSTEDPEGKAADEAMLLKPMSSPFRNWSVQLGVAFIAANDVGEVLSGGLEPAEGDGGGQVYSLMANWVAHRFEIPFRESILTPQFEPYVSFALVDENGRSVFPDYNGGVGFRWVDFPWNKWVKTGFYTGVGLSYSSRVYTVDRVRHPGQHRSHLKIDWPFQFTFALPRWPQQQLVIFNDHQSGGHIFDKGGVNSVGIAFRCEF